MSIDDRLAGPDAPGRPPRDGARRCWDPRRRSRTRPASWPSASSRSRTSRATSASVRPTSRPPRSRARPGRRPGPPRRSSATSSASLRIRSGRRTGRREREPGAGEHPLQPQHERRPQPVGHGDRSQIRRGAAQRGLDSAARDEPHRVLGLLPGRDLDRPGAAAAAQVCAGVASSRGAIERARHALGGRQHEHRQPLQRQRLVAREVAQVRARRRSAARRGRPPAASRRAGGEPLRVALRGDRRVMRSSSVVPGERPAIQPRASSRSPCSNSAR